MRKQDTFDTHLNICLGKHKIRQRNVYLWYYQIVK